MRWRLIFLRGFCRGSGWQFKTWRGLFCFTSQSETWVQFFLFSFLHFWTISGHFSSCLVQVDGVRNKNYDDEEKTYDHFGRHCLETLVEEYCVFWALLAVCQHITTFTLQHYWWEEWLWTKAVGCKQTRNKPVFLYTPKFKKKKKKVSLSIWLAVQSWKLYIVHIALI